MLILMQEEKSFRSETQAMLSAIAAGMPRVCFLFVSSFVPLFSLLILTIQKLIQPDVIPLPKASQNFTFYRQSGRLKHRERQGYNEDVCEH